MRSVDAGKFFIKCRKHRWEFIEGACYFDGEVMDRFSEK
jgi:hypothetical protein